MSTSEELQKLKDTSKFELLATAVLSKAEHDYRAILHSGLNAQGQPVKSPVDGFCQIPNSKPPHFIWIEHTIEEKLEKKWLSDHRIVQASTKGRKNKLSESDDGDLLKAGLISSQYKSKFPEARFTVVLTTNKGLKPDLCLKVFEKAEELGVSVDFWDQSRIARFLDTDPEGQLIRKIFLGFNIELSSESLLREIADISLDEHQRVFGFGDNNYKEIVRDIHGQVINLLKKSSAKLIGLQGASGTGKSTLLRQIGKDLNESGDIALWVSEEIIKSSFSLQELLLKALKQLHPSLNENAGNETIRIISLSSCKLFILVDDINRSDNPAKLIANLEVLAKGIENNSIKFVVPLWLGQLAAKPRDGQSKENSLWENIELGIYSPDERIELSKNHTNSDSEQISQLIEALNGDPFLCGIALQNKETVLSYSSSDLLENIFSQFLEDLSTTVNKIGSRAFTLNECKGTVDKLIEFILQENNPEPFWEDISKFLGDSQEILRSIAVTNRLGWIDQKDGLDFWRWKHDKIRDALIGRYLASTILTKISSESRTSRNIEYLSNLGLAEAWAFALTFLTKRNLRENAISLLAQYQPLALAELLRLNFIRSNQSDNLSLLASQTLRRILCGYLSVTSHDEYISETLILTKLSETNSVFALEATKELPKHEITNIWAARFRNGDLTAGIEWINYELKRGIFLPQFGYTLFEQSVKSFENIYSNNRHEIANKIEDMLECHQTSIPSILLVGYLTWGNLAISIWKCWNDLPINQKYIATAPLIWSLGRCNHDSVQHNLEEALLFTIQLSQASDAFEKSKGEGYIPRGIESIWLHWILHISPSSRYPITDQATKVWLSAINNIPCFKSFWNWLEEIDHPKAIETFVRSVADESNNKEDKFFERFYRFEESRNYHDPIENPKFSKNRFSHRTRQTLLNIFKSESDYLTRLIAFLLWKRGILKIDLTEIQDILPNDEIFNEVLEVRLKLSDRTAAKYLIDRLKSYPKYWCVFVPFLQDIPEVFETFLNILEISLEFGDMEKNCHRRNSVAKYLSVEKTRELVQKKRDILVQSPQTWLALWCSDVPEALNLVQEAMIQSDTSDWYFFFFPCDSFKDTISLQMLDTLLPILDKHPNLRQEIAKRAAEKGFGDWMYEHFPDLVVNPEIRYYFPTKEDVIDTLMDIMENASKYNVLSPYSNELYHIRSAFYQRANSNSFLDIQAILKDWIGCDVEINRLNITAKILALWGDSEDIDWWEKLEPIDQSVYIVWQNALNILKRRRWHSMDEYMFPS